MSLLDRLRKAKEPVKKEEEKKQEAISEKELNEKLKGFLYSDDLVEEYTNTFRKLYDIPEFQQVMELIEAKEQELNSINQAADDYFKEQAPDNQTSENETEEENTQDKDYLMQILEERYNTKL